MNLHGRILPTVLHLNTSSVKPIQEVCLSANFGRWHSDSSLCGFRNRSHDRGRHSTRKTTQPRVAVPLEPNCPAACAIVTKDDSSLLSAKFASLAARGSEHISDLAFAWFLSKWFCWTSQQVVPRTSQAISERRADPGCGLEWSAVAGGSSNRLHRREHSQTRRKIGALHTACLRGHAKSRPRFAGAASALGQTHVGNQRSIGSPSERKALPQREAVLAGRIVRPLGARCCRVCSNQDLH
jgi:hypothetical protein